MVQRMEQLRMSVSEPAPQIKVERQASTLFSAIQAISKPVPAAFLLLIFAVVVRRVFFIPTEGHPDYGLYVVQAREWLRGGWPYIAVWDLHPIGEPALITAAFAVFGQKLVVLRLLGAVAVATSGLLLRQMVAAHARDGASGLAAGIIYIAYSTMSEGVSVNNELVLAPFVIAGVGLTIHAARRVLNGGTLKRFDVSLPGLCFGVA